MLDCLKNGYAPEFAQGKPALTDQWWLYESAGGKSPGEKGSLLQQHVDELLAKEAVEVVRDKHSRGFYSHLFLVPKKNGQHRPVINLRELNQYLVIPRLSMETTGSVAAAVQPGDWATSIDLADAYFHVPILPAFRKYMRIVVNGKVYQFKALPFGLSTAPLVFTKILEPLATLLHSQGVHMHRYLDDILIRSNSKDQCQLWTEQILQLLFTLGLGVNLEKSDMIPSQDFTYIGIRFQTDRAIMVPPDDRIAKIRSLGLDLIKGGGAPASTWLSLIGLLGSAEKQVPLGRLHIRPIHQCLREQFLIGVHPLGILVNHNEEVVAAIKWWTTDTNLQKGQPLGQFKPDIVMHSDASLQSWGAHAPQFQVSGNWSQLESQWSINALELLAVVKALQRAPTSWYGKKLMVASDNTSAVAYMNHQGGTRSFRLMEATAQLFQVLQDKQITMRARHIPGRLNRMADLLSRSTGVVNTEWTLHRSVFKQICVVWGPLEVDLMATYLNHQLPQFVSPAPDPQAVAVDAMSIPWTWRTIYVFPPWSMIAAVLQKLTTEKDCYMILIAPMWPNRPWFPLLLSLLVDHPRALPHRPDLLSMPINGIHHEYLESLNLHVWRLSSSTQEIEDFQRRLRGQSLSARYGDPRSDSMTPDGPHSRIGALNGATILSRPL